MSKLLFDAPPLLIDPNLAKIIGLNEAIVLQQLHYWLENNKKKNNNFKDGYYWTFNSYKQWQEQFPFWCLRTLKTIFSKLENKKIIISGNYNKFKFDRTKWYRIDYNLVETLANIHSANFAQCKVQKMHDIDSANFAPTIPETTEINNSEITNANGRRLEKKSSTTQVKLSFQEFLNKNQKEKLNKEAVEAIRYYIKKYECTFKKNHQKYCAKTWLEQLDTMLVGEMDTLSVEDLETMIDKHFQTDYKGNCDYQLLHFNTEGIKKNRFYEVCY